jgi:superfamily II DNA or RNA helicase
MNLLSSQYKFMHWGRANLLQFLNKLPEFSPHLKTPRQYQAVAINRCQELFESIDSGVVVFATGLGKSMILAQLAAWVAEDLLRPVLVLADRIALIEQLESSLWSQLNRSTPTRLWDGRRKPNAFNGITVASQQSVFSFLNSGGVLPKFGIILVDECHHALSETYRTTLQSIDTDFTLGVTATPWRGDQALLSDLFATEVARMGLVEGIERGFLADVQYEMFGDDVDWEAVAANSEKNLTIRDLNRLLFLNTRDEKLCEVASSRWFELNKPQTITFSPSIQHAEIITRLFNSYGLPSKVIHSGLPMAEQTRVLIEFKSGKFSNLVSVDKLNEGIDVPDVALVIFARVTHSRRIFIQQLGRGLRVTPKKKKVVVLDFVSDIRRLAEGFRLNQERRAIRSLEHYSGVGADLVTFSTELHGSFVSEYLVDVADLEESDRVKLDFISPN